MDGERFRKKLETEFPERDIFVGDGIVGVVASSTEDGGNVAVAYIDYESSHYHTMIGHIYEVQEGELSLLEAGKQITLRQGEEHTIPPGKVHSSHGDATRVRITSTPGQISEDHTHFPKK